MQYATDTCHAALYGKPTADTLFRYFNKCVVLRAIGKIIKVNNERINVDLFCKYVNYFPSHCTYAFTAVP